MPYEELIEYLKECCIDNVPVSMSSVLNTIKQNDEIYIDYITISDKGSVYSISYGSKVNIASSGENISLSPIYRIDIRKMDNSDSTSIIFNYDKDICKINKVLFISSEQSSVVGTYCEDVKDFINKR